MEASTDTRRHLSAQAWGEVFRRFDSSGESVVSFCKREGLNTSSFHRWRRRLETPGGAAKTSSAPRQAPRQPAAASFIEMGSVAAASRPTAARLELKLELGGGVVLHLVRG